MTPSRTFFDCALFVLWGAIFCLMGSDVLASGLTSDPAWTYNAQPIWIKKTPEERSAETEITLQDLENQISDISKYHGLGALGVVIVDANADTPIWHYGAENPSVHARIGADSVHVLGSASKMLIGLAVMHLVERGTLTLNDTLAELAPEIRFDNPWENTHPVRLGDLLEGTAGWDGMHYAEKYRYVDEPEDLLSLLNAYDLSRVSRWPPGTRRATGSVGEVVAAYIVEKKTQQSFSEFINDTFLIPLGMRHTGYLPHIMAEKQLIGRYPHLDSFSASVDDMAKLMSLFVFGGRVDGKQLIQTSSIARMEVSRRTLGSRDGNIASHGATLDASGRINYGVPFYGKRSSFARFGCSPALKKGYFVVGDKGGLGVRSVAEAVIDYMLQTYKIIEEGPYPLPKSYLNLQGYYKRISGYKKRNQFVGDLIGVIKISAHTDKLQRLPLLGEHPTNDFYTGAKGLVNGWSGLPVLATVQDPVEGEVLQAWVSLKKTSAAVVYGKLIFITLLSLFGVISLLYGVYFFIRCFLKREYGFGRMSMHLLPSFISLVAVIVLCIFLLNPDSYDLGRKSYKALGLYVLSGLYGGLSIVSLCITSYAFFMLRQFHFLALVIVSLMHFLFVLYLSGYDLIFMKTWQM